MAIRAGRVGPNSPEAAAIRIVAATVADRIGRGTLCAAGRLGRMLVDAATYEEIKRLALAGGLWNCQPLTQRSAPDGRRSFVGWVVPPGARPVRYVIHVDGRPVALDGTRRTAAGAAEHVLARCGLAGRYDEFTFQFDLPAEPAADVEIGISFDGLQGHGGLLPFHVPARRPAIEPSRLVMERTTRIKDSYLFHYNGRTDFGRLQALYDAAAPGHPQRPRILDWGCGCGRVSSFMEAAYGNENVFGVDIDAVGIGWLLEQGGSGRYRQIGGDFSLPFAAGSFDLIYGISVMTHLRRADQRRWLEELARVLAPGGVAILTFHSLAMFFTHVNHGPALEQLLSEGFWDVGRCADLDEGSPEAAATDSYRTVFNTHGNILELCPPSCDVVDIVVGGSSAQHDCVVFRRRPEPA